jgi:hypothetical protein
MSDKSGHKDYIGDIKTGTSDSILAALFRTILFDLGITTARFNTLLERYLISSNMPKNIETVSSLRGNLKKELLKNTMSFKVFIKGLVFLNVKKFELKITLYHGNNQVTIHTKTVSLNTFNEEIEHEDF